MLLLKICKTCKKEKELIDFNYYKDDEYMDECIKCYEEKIINFYNKNKEKFFICGYSKSKD